jgi:peptide/nickel transport system ATP-binding protein
VQREILAQIVELQSRLRFGILFITHDLSLLLEIADRIAVMYAGRIVEIGPVAQVLSSPLHPYTAGLLASTVHGQEQDRDIDAIPGSPPDMRRLPQGCSFAPRCSRRVAACRTTLPAALVPSAGRLVACHSPVTGSL